MSTTEDWGTPLIPAGGSAQAEIIHNEAIRRCEVLAAGIAHFILAAPTGSEADGTVVIVATPATDEFEGQDNKIGHKFGGAWRYIPDVDSTGADIPIGARHAGLRFYLQDDGSSPTVASWRLWTGSAWIAD